MTPAVPPTPFRIALLAYAKSIGAALPSSVQTLGNR